MSNIKGNQDWQDGSFIPSETNFEEEESTTEEELIFSWFTVKFNMAPTKTEEMEKFQAIREQIQAGILQPNGLPYGYGMHENKPKSKTVGGGKMARRAMRKIERERKKKNKII